jgi:hypothetical protein
VQIPARLMFWVAALALFAVLSGILKPPDAQRLETARLKLVAAGFRDAKVARSQGPVNMSECGVGQIKNRGYVYGWTSSHGDGVYCYPIDGRPQRIIVHKLKEAPATPSP